MTKIKTGIFYKNMYYKDLYVFVDRILEKQTKKTLAQITWWRLDNTTNKVVCLSIPQEVWLDENWKEADL